MIFTMFTKSEWLPKFLDRLRDTLFQITFIQRKFRDVSLLLRQRQHALRHSILPQQTLQITRSIMKSSQTAALDERSNQLGMKLVEMSSAKKDFVCETFIVLAKLDFRKQFLEWFVRTKIDVADYPEDFEEKKEEIKSSVEKGEQQLAKLLDFIYDGTDKRKRATRWKNAQGKLVKKKVMSKARGALAKAGTESPEKTSKPAGERRES